MTLEEGDEEGEGLVDFGPGSILGHSVLRVEDPALLTGAARFLDDLPAEGGLHAVFVRSFVAHARLLGIATEEARGMPGVVCVLTGADLGLPPMHEVEDVPETFARPILSDGIMRFVGEPVAVVVADSRAQAVDAAESVLVEYDPLPAVVDPVRALEPDAPVLFPEHGSNAAVEYMVADDPGALEEAEVVIRARFVNQRLAPTPMETNGALAIPDPDTGGLTVWLPVQAPFASRKTVARILGLEESKVRVIAPKVGGAFGAKIPTYAEQVAVCALALRLGRPVRYVETRTESMTVMTHGRAQVQDVELGARRDGTITGLRVRITADAGAYPDEGATLPPLTGLMASGPYTIPRIHFTAAAVATNTTPIGAYRGAGRPEATALLERVIDMLAAELGMDPVEVRRRNLIPPSAFPYETPTEAVYDTGEYGLALDEAVGIAGYDDLRDEQRTRRERGDRMQLGIGVSVYVEVTGWGTEFGSVAVKEDGSVVVRCGTSPQGQGHETAYAQIASGILGIPTERITVEQSDTGILPRGEGTMGSRSLQVGGSAVLRASELLREKARRLAAHLLEVSVDDVVSFEGGRIGVAGAPDSALGWDELARAAADATRLPQDMDPGLAAEHDFEIGDSTYPFGAHISVVEVDLDTGDARPLRHVAVDDCGRILNPMMVEGQVHGGVAQGIAQALYEEVIFDEDGNPLTSNLTTYSIPSAAELPGYETAHTITPTTRNPLGAKGIGESGTIGAGPAVHNAVVDALSYLGVRHIDMPASPERVWRAIRDAGTTNGTHTVPTMEEGEDGHTEPRRAHRGDRHADGGRLLR